MAVRRPRRRVIETPLGGRDLAIVQLVTRFRQLSSKQISLLVFDGLSAKPCARALIRLTEAKFLRRIPRRMVGGALGGSGQYVYVLGRRGFGLSYEGRYTPARLVNYHSYEVAEAFLTVKQLERAGHLTIAAYSTEPDSWAVVGGQELRPDLYLELVRPSGKAVKLFLEVDLATEAQRQIKGQLTAYRRAVNEVEHLVDDADYERWRVFPRVLWVAVDEERAKELRWLIGQEPEQYRELYDVTTTAGLSDYLCTGT